ncbi:DEAD/DEAH box helicase family protein [Alicyclobacillus tolerans]|uniref:helicase-related protein n=1 Tax=Alicyclobacillus tolerans TaxID=90970 RepID=UPI001F2DBCCB|nr:helicase-related protein [Alicyclobacillus tolerans]MCF8568415.1 DEAD/DEAH box helicase family protein [Alicyclobacillus tolerans]
MKILSYQDDKNFIEAAVHMTVTRRNVEKNAEDLIAVGLIDLDSPTRALVAHVLKGDRMRLKWNRQSFSSDTVYTDKYAYRFVARPIGKLTHAMVLHKAAVDEQLESGVARVLIVPQGGDVAELFLRRFASDFNLPYVQAWKDTVWQACREQDYVQSLTVWTDPNVPSWQGLQAFELSTELTEEAAKMLLGHLLAQGKIELPVGVTDAPTLSEALHADEQGGFQVIDYLQTFAPHLATTIEDLAAPAHDLDRPIHQAIAKMQRVPFPAQAHTVQAILNGFDTNKGIIASSDMGTGKSIISLAVANALAERSNRGLAVLLLVPGITIPKWVQGEIGKTIPNARITVFESWKDVVRYRDKRVRKGDKAPIEFILLSRDTAKLGMTKAPALIYKERWVIPNKARWHEGYNKASMIEEVWLCPECGGIQQKHTKTAEKDARKHDNEADQIAERKLGFKDLATGQRSFVASGIGSRERQRIQYMFKKSLTEYHCSECDANLMRDVVPERETVSSLKHRRLQPAWFIQKYLRGWFDLTIIDEIHQYKSNSGQGEAMGAIAGASKRILGLTGTLSDGKASSLYHLLWRICPAQMKADGLDHRSLNKFVHLYGTMEQRGRYAEDDVAAAGGSTSRKLILNPPKEVPGLSPKLFVNHLADKTVFLELGDMGLPLVELDERPIFIDMHEEHGAAYQAFHNELETVMRQQYAIGNVNAFAKFIPSVVNASNQPHVSQTVTLGDDGVSFFAPNHEQTLSAKEERLLEDIQSELALKRRCVVYVRYSGDAEQDKRIADVLKQRGIRVQTLQASVPPEDRVEWLERAVDKGTEVVVCNAKLVEVGLDLMFFPTLLFYQFTDEIATMRQASRRAWRIGQHRACKVFYYIYNGSYEMVQFRRMLQKRSHAMLLEGRLDKSEVSQFAVQDDKSASTFAIANCLGNVEDLAQKWKSLADKDIPSGVTMLAEERFKQEIGRAMNRLASETRRLANVSEPADDKHVSTTETPVVGVVDSVERGIQTDKKLVVLPLFTERGIENLSDVDAPTIEVPITIGDLRRKMGLVEKVKPSRRKVSDDQIALFALDAI